jgi:hypothetical protein
MKESTRDRIQLRFIIIQPELQMKTDYDPKYESIRL